MWKFKWYGEYEKRQAEYQKNHPDSLKYLLSKLQVVQRALSQGQRVQQLNYNFLRPVGRNGVFEIRSSGRKKRVARLYFYPDERNSTFHIFTLGDKNTQIADIAACSQSALVIKSSP